MPYFKPKTSSFGALTIALFTIVLASHLNQSFAAPISVTGDTLQSVGQNAFPHAPASVTSTILAPLPRPAPRPPIITHADDDESTIVPVAPLRLTNGEEVLRLTNGEEVLRLTNGDEVLRLTNGEEVLRLTNGEKVPRLTNGEDVIRFANGEEFIRLKNSDTVHIVGVDGSVHSHSDKVESELEKEESISATNPTTAVPRRRVSTSDSPMDIKDLAAFLSQMNTKSI